ncbi:MAG: bifunctional phosphoribosyl-AMP cyclohydrolase/phosphoribosyl-ATP diphosphatase HisIE [Clostridiales Family XIII bacterium]|jgi:phosphoribosyl-ATP pyrophosphohydrolase/phosphoribosyl-AMP cyclohydrolase|nr:bifunctional phosphoribosyl-AMP cyclohydrolase/phosphoribosyl-ATP diphosphatase HisIE [Clostridiales Family XIII bacterium]
MRFTIVKQISFDENGLVPVVVQDKKTDVILMLAYANEEAIKKTLETGFAHYFSRSRNKLWKKGEESGNIQKIDSIAVDCDGDAILYKVFQKGNACHTGNYSCFFRKENLEKKTLSPDIKSEVKNQDGRILIELYKIILDRKNNKKDGSYTNYLFNKGIDKILKKIGEEAAETIIAAKTDEKDEIINEVSDLIYHLLVMLVEEDIDIKNVLDELRSRAEG